MPKLHEINALVSGTKTEAQRTISDLYKIIQKPDLFDGRQGSYKPKDEDGDKMPPEQQLVQKTYKQVLKELEDTMSDLYNKVGTQDAGNQVAKADVIVENITILPQVPVTTLLFLEKQLTDLCTFCEKLPTPAPTEEWDYEPNADLLQTKPSTQYRTKKVFKNHVKAEATDKHPAQVETYTEDVQVGTWTRIMQSGKIPAKDRNEYVSRIKQLKDAVKLARETANQTEVKPVKFAKSVFDFVFARK